MSTTTGNLELAGAASKTHDVRAQACIFHLKNFVANAQSATSSVQVVEIIKQVTV